MPDRTTDSTWNAKAIRELLSAAFDDEEITTLCYNSFHEVHELFSTGTSKAQKIQLLLDYCVRKVQLEELLKLVKERNPAQYARLVPSLQTDAEPQPQPPVITERSATNEARLIRLLEYPKGEGMLKETIVKYALTKALDLGRNLAEKMWNQGFPPIPLYIIALQEAVKEIQDLWAKEKDVLPQLDIHEAMRNLKWEDLDRAKIEGWLSVSVAEVERVLTEQVTGVEKDVAAMFVKRAVETADKKFKRAITLDNRREAAPLWKQYITQIAVQQNQRQTQVLERLASVEELLKFWITPISQVSSNVDTLDSVLAQETELVQVSPSNSLVACLASIERTQLLDQYSETWYQWWTQRNEKRFREPRCNYFKERLAQSRLSPPEEEEYEKVRQGWEKAVRDMSQTKADLLVLAEHAEKMLRSSS